MKALYGISLLFAAAFVHVTDSCSMSMEHFHENATTDRRHIGTSHGSASNLNCNFTTVVDGTITRVDVLSTTNDWVCKYNENTLFIEIYWNSGIGLDVYYEPNTEPIPVDYSKCEKSVL